MSVLVRGFVFETQIYLFDFIMNQRFVYTLVIYLLAQVGRDCSPYITCRYVVAALRISYTHISLEGSLRAEFRGNPKENGNIKGNLSWMAAKLQS